MAATVQASRPSSLNRRRRVRQKVHAPAYASFFGSSENETLDLYEILDISEVGVAVQCVSPMEIGKQVDVCLDLAEAREQISTTARVVWSDSAGRVGLGLAPLPNSALHCLREWLFLNAMAAAANAAASGAQPSTVPARSVLPPSYPDTLTAAASAVQRECESLGADIEAVLSLVASRSQSLLRASGAAIALAAKDSGNTLAGTTLAGTTLAGTTLAGTTLAETMTCRASAGPSAPPVGATLQVGSGFSGECVRTGSLLRCDDTETDSRVDSRSCRALGVRSMLAAPVCSDAKVIGLIEVFSAQPKSFSENDGAVLQRFAETILAAVNRAARRDEPPNPPPPAPKPFTAQQGSVLFAHMPEEKPEQKPAEKTEKKNVSAGQDKVGGIRVPRAHLYLLFCVAATIALALGVILAQPWVQKKIQEKLWARGHTSEQTVLASSRPRPRPRNQYQWFRWSILPILNNSASWRREAILPPKMLSAFSSLRATKNRLSSRTTARLPIGLPKPPSTATCPPNTSWACSTGVAITACPRIRTRPISGRCWPAPVARKAAKI